MIKLNADTNISNYTLILPSVAVGNIGQLTVDLFISTLGLKKIGQLFDSALIPLVGANPYNENQQNICTSVDVYVNHEIKFAALQIRSPFTKNPANLMNILHQFIIDHQIGKVIIFTSSYAHEKRDLQIRTSPMRYLASSSTSIEHKEQFKKMSWIELEPTSIEYLPHETSLEIAGGGFAKNLFELLDKSTIPCIILIRSCSEGDNILDAIELANYFNAWLQLVPTDQKDSGKYKYPPSWKFLFGNAPPSEIY